MHALDFSGQQTSSIFNQQFFLSMELGEIDRKIDKITDQPALEKAQKIYARIETAGLATKELEKRVEALGDNSGLSDTMVHLSTKLEDLQKKFKTIPPKLRQSIIEQKPLNIPISKQPRSFTITSCGPHENTNISISSALSRISFLLRNENESLALEEFSKLPDTVKQRVFAALWIVRGRPTGNDNFGQVSFMRMDPSLQCAPRQKACAVELYITEATIQDTIELLKQNQTKQAIELFLSLPAQIKSEIYGKHWEICGKPTHNHRDESMKKIAHDDFGKVSFLGLEDYCNVPSAKKIETLGAYFPQLTEKNKIAQELTESIAKTWWKIDLENARGSEKNNKKKETIIYLAKMILSLFLEENHIIEVPTPPINPKTQSPSDSYIAQACAFVEKYPCLKPFLLQLAPIKFQNEILPQEILLDSSKSCEVQYRNFDSKSFAEKKQYRTDIINETLATLDQGYYINSKNEKISFDLQSAIHSLELQTNRSFGMKCNAYNTQLFLDKKDCLTVTRDLAERGLNPIVLDAASENRFGGGYKTGAGAQEENMCRRSGLSIAVDRTQGRQQNDHYPLMKNGHDAGLYVAHVPVFRGEEIKGYPYLDKPFETAVAIVAAYNFNEEHHQSMLSRGEQPVHLENHNGELRIPNNLAKKTKDKLRTVLGMAESKGHESVVLIPLGCGAFRNPPKHVSEILMELITEEFPHSFKEIRISIIDDHNTGLQHNRRGNFIEFKETIESNRFQNQLQNNNITFQLT